jgi:hypothetical protein
MSALDPKTEVAALRRDVCLTPMNGQSQIVSACPKSAKGVSRPYSITSSICASGDAGTVRLSALAALRLRTNATSQAAGPDSHPAVPLAFTA